MSNIDTNVIMEVKYLQRHTLKIASWSWPSYLGYACINLTDAYNAFFYRGNGIHTIIHTIKMQYIIAIYKTVVSNNSIPTLLTTFIRPSSATWWLLHTSTQWLS